MSITPLSGGISAPAGETALQQTYSSRGSHTHNPSGNVANQGNIASFIWRLHLYIGVFVAPLMVIAALSGLAYILSVQISPHLWKNYYSVQPTAATQLNLDQQASIAAAHHPNWRLSEYLAHPGPKASTELIFTIPGQPQSPRAVFLNPYTGQEIGDLPFYDNLDSPLTHTVDEFHRSLLLGNPGRIYSELAASWLWVAALSGIILSLKARKRLTPTAGKHKNTGIFVCVGLFFLSATGITWSAHAGENVHQLRNVLHWSNPSMEAHSQVPGGKLVSQSGMIPVHKLSLTAIDKGIRNNNTQEINAPYSVMLPTKAMEPVTVTEIAQPYRSGINSLALDQYTYQAIGHINFSHDYSTMAKLAFWGVRMHEGVLFGLVNQVLLAITALGLITLIVLGYRMWWRKRARGIRFPRGGIWLALPIKYRPILAGVIGLIGIFLPTLGISLLVFTVIDAIMYLYSPRPMVA